MPIDETSLKNLILKDKETEEIFEELNKIVDSGYEFKSNRGSFRFYNWELFITNLVHLFIRVQSIPDYFNLNDALRLICQLLYRFTFLNLLAESLAKKLSNLKFLNYEGNECAANHSPASLILNHKSSEFSYVNLMFKLDGKLYDIVVYPAMLHNSDYTETKIRIENFTAKKEKECFINLAGVNLTTIIFYIDSVRN